MTRTSLHHVIGFAITALLVSGCHDLSGPGTPAPDLLISDAVHGAGKPHFYFLPPMVGAPTVTGTFDAQLSPAVEICVLAGSQCGSLIASYTTTGGSGSEVVRVDPAAQSYIVNWHTDQFALDPSLTYRIRVLVGTVELGFADVDVVNSGRDLRNVNTGEYIGLVDGRTLPIKFRVETDFLAVIQVVPVSATTEVSTTQQFQAILLDLHGGTLAGPPPAVTWTSSDPGVATVDGTGLASGVGTGTTTIAAAAAGTMGSATLTVVAGAVIGAGLGHACSVRSNGAVYCWGLNVSGQLGNGTTTNSAVPVAVLGGYAFTTVGGSQQSTCGLVVGGAAYCWGSNGSGGLGIGTIGGIKTAPTPVVGGHNFAQLQTGGSSACGITTSHGTYCWGFNGSGQLGNGTTATAPAPVPVVGGFQFAEITVGDNQACGITTGGAAYCWGADFFGQLGNGPLPASTTPSPVAGGLTFTSISGTRNHVCGLTPAGSAYCWGANSSGAIGDGTTLTRTVPTAVSGGLSFTAVATGGEHSCGIDTSGAAYCWGGNTQGQLGTGSTLNSSIPVPVSGGLSFTALSLGATYSCGLTTTGGTWCWGSNTVGQLGIGAAGGMQLGPVAVSGLP